MAQFLRAILSTSNTPPVPEGILAFRSITRLTSIIQQGPFSDLSDEKTPEKEDRRELRLSVAFSILAALEHEVVAVMSKPMAGRLEVIVCSNLPHDKDQTFLRQLGNTIMDFEFTKNDRPTDPRHADKSEYPSIFYTSPPPELKKSTWMELESYVNKLW
jgi:hypothetical protein